MPLPSSLTCSHGLSIGQVLLKPFSASYDLPLILCIWWWVKVFFLSFLISHWPCDGCGDGGWWSGDGGVGLVFSLSSFQFHRSGVCGLIFAIWFSIGLDCGFCTFGFWFSISWLLVPRFWFLCSLGLDFYVLLRFVSIFIFLCLLLFMLFDLVIFMFFFFL